MLKATEKRKELERDEERAAEKARVKEATLQKATDDLLQFQLCARQCVCDTHASGHSTPNVRR